MSLLTGPSAWVKKARVGFGSKASSHVLQLTPNTHLLITLPLLAVCFGVFVCTHLQYALGLQRLVDIIDYVEN